MRPNQQFIDSLTIKDRYVNYGANNVIFGRYEGIGGSLTTDRFVMYLKFEITSTSTTNVGIKVPIVSATSSLGIPANSVLGVQRVNVVGDSPDNSSSSGWPVGFNRTNWTTSSDSNNIYLYTSNSTQKSALTVGESYWFSIQLKADSGFFYPTLSVNIDGSINLKSAASSTVATYNATYSTTVLDYNI